MVALTKFGLLASALFISSSLAAPVDVAEDAINEFVERFATPDVSYTEEDLNEFTERQNGYFAVTGVQDGQLGVRQKLEDLAANPDKYNIFLLGLLNMQNVDQNNKLSYYQIAGIHGVPNIPWDGVTGSGGSIGYCPHGSILFPVWHRAYMGLFEQIWKQNVNAVVNQYTGSQKTRYQNAANGLRFPFWDWANAPGDVMPSMITNPYVTLDTPTGSQQIVNPLFRYGFHPLNKADMYTTPWNYWPVTFRWPTTMDPNQVQNTYSQNNLAVGALNNLRGTLRQATYNLFTTCADYTSFSNDAADGNSNCQLSLEGIHDYIHINVGGSNKGHMQYLWWAAFDPAFWLHHMNVERIFSIWQAVNKNSYFPTTWNLGSNNNYYYHQNQIVGASTPLAPFHRDTAGNFWQGDNIFNHRVFGSTFPEFVGWDGNSATMRATVNRLYGNSGATRKRDLTDMIPSLIANVSDIIPAIVNAIPDNSFANLLTPTGRTMDWEVNIQTSRFGLDNSYSIYFFMGQPAGDFTAWPTASNMIGAMAVLAQPGMAGKMGNDTIYGQVPLNDALVNALSAGAIKDLTPASVTPYLAKHLRWRVVAGFQEFVPAKQVPGLKIRVSHSKVTPAPNDSEFPTYDGFTDAVNATAGKTGGIGSLVGSLISALNVVNEHDCE